jgi:hypothetical protein
MVVLIFPQQSNRRFGYRIIRINSGSVDDLYLAICRKNRSTTNQNNNKKQHISIAIQVELHVMSECWWTNHKIIFAISLTSTLYVTLF